MSPNRRTLEVCHVSPHRSPVTGKAGPNDRIARFSVRGALALSVYSFYSMADDDGEDLITAAALVRFIQGAQAGGRSAVLLEVDSRGGQFVAAMLAYQAMRAFSAAGGSIVAYVAGWAASAAAMLILGTDFVVAHPGAIIWPHGARTDMGGPQTDDLGSEAQQAALLATRTLIPDGLVAALLAGGSTAEEPGGLCLSAAKALELGYVDLVGGPADALHVAQRLAKGRPVSSARQDALTSRVPSPEHLATLRRLPGDLEMLSILAGI